MSANSVKCLCRFAMLLCIAVAACQNKDTSPGSTPDPAPITYSVSATISGLNGAGLVLQNNGGGDITVNANGSVTFASQASGTAYAVTVFTQPPGTAQTCTVAGGSGTIAQANVTNATVTCADNFVPTYTPAPKGDPQGTATTQMIDVTGGSVTSADGRITLNIPAGALGTATTISIQPITNTIPNGIGLGYSLQPEGTTFAAPVSLTFRLSTTEALALDSTFVATQHADGLWYSQPNQQRDGSAQTVGVSTTHFSDWTIAETLALDPAKARVKTSDGTNFTAHILLVQDDDDELAQPGTEEIAVPQETVLDNQLNGSKIWSVNGIVEGNSQFGEVRSPGSYTAPVNEPTPNTVVVTLTMQFGKAKVIAPAEATIYAQELWTGTTDITQIDGTQIHADVTFMNKPDPSNSVTVLHFVVMSGNVHVKIPSTNGSGCSQSVSPVDRAIGAANASYEGGDGSMTLNYSANPEDAEVTAGGTTAWPATLTTVCSNTTQTLATTEVAAWWPVTEPPVMYEADNGVLDANISTPTATGTAHFVRQ
ncbi:MAG TPA: hypothetical protein VK743_18280 [Steroidobacteraceae bacterium]|nr:hypothetical protein [Steroidobacteraceae bacterium]